MLFKLILSNQITIYYYYYYYVELNIYIPYGSVRFIEIGQPLAICEVWDE